MKSKITIEVDFENNNQSVISIFHRQSDDVRDKLIQSFFEKLQGSSWCKIFFVADAPAFAANNGEWVDGFKRAHITPISTSELKEHVEKMNEEIRSREKIEKIIKAEPPSGKSLGIAHLKDIDLKDAQKHR